MICFYTVNQNLTNIHKTDIICQYDIYNFAIHGGINMNGKRLGILALLFATLTIISCGGGGGGGGGGSSTTPSTQGSNSIIGRWTSTKTASNGTVVTAELYFDSSTYRHVHKENGTVLTDFSVPYTLSNNSIVFDRGNAVVSVPSGTSSLPSANCSYTYSLNGNSLVISEYLIDGVRQPTVFGTYDSITFTRM